MKNENQMAYLGTVFSNCMDTHGHPLDFFTWMADILNGKYQSMVEQVRSLKAAGKKVESDNLKKKLPTYIPTCVIPDGRTAQDPVQSYSRIVMLDYDNHNHEWSAAQRERVKQEKGVIGCHETPNFGLRIFVYTPVFNREDFNFVLNVVSAYFDKLLNYQHDKSVDKLVHLTSSSYDPDAFVATPDTVTEFPFHEILAQIQRQVYNEFNQVAPAEADEDMTDEEAEEPALSAGFEAAERLSRKIDLDNHFARFQESHPLTMGSRNNNLVHLGQYAHFMNYNQEELEYLIRTATALINDRQFPEKVVRTAVCWGYKHNDKQLEKKKFAKHDLDESAFGKSAKSSQSSQSSHPYRGFEDGKSQESDFQEDFMKKVNEFCTYIPDIVYEKLPSFFKPLLYKSGNRRDTDISFLGTLAAVTSCLPGVEVRCRKHTYSPHVFFLVIGPPASGKSIANKSTMLLEDIQKQIENQNAIRSKDYKNRLQAWDLEKRVAAKELRKANPALDPGDEPLDRTLVADVHTSRSKLVLDLSVNEHGLYLFSTELNSLNESLNNDCGQFNAELCAIAMNERTSYNYKNDKHRVVAKKPKMTLFCEGTPESYVKFIGSTHDGMESRAYTLLTTSGNDWLSWANEDEEAVSETDEAFREASKQLLQIYNYLLASPTKVSIPANLRSKCDNYFSYYLGRLQDTHYDRLDSIIKRCPILVAKICGVLCALRKYEMNLACTSMDATEEEVDIALSITLTLMKHTCLAVTMIPKNQRQINTIQSVYRQEDLYNCLPDEFTCKELIAKCLDTFHCSKATASRDLKCWKENGYVVVLRKGRYAKTGKDITGFRKPN